MGLHEVPGYLEPLDLELVLLLSVAVPGVAVMITDPLLYSKCVQCYRGSCKDNKSCTVK